MEIVEKNDDSIRNYSVPMNPNASPYLFIEGYLEKKGRILFVGWQKRYFRCLEGKIIIYTNTKESKQLKGCVQIKNIQYIKSIDAKTFLFEANDRQFLLKAENEGIKKKWIDAITYLMENNSQRLSKEKNSSSFDFNKSEDSIIKKLKMKSEEDTIKTISKKAADLIRKYGYILNKEDPLSRELLETKGINKLININDPKIIYRIHYGFLFIKQKNFDIFNKRWFFIFSRRPLYDEYYSKDDNDLDNRKQKDWIKFDVLYYFKFDKKEKDAKDSKYTASDGEIEMAECHKMINYEKDGKYFMNLDAGDRTFLFYSQAKSERDEWFEILKNSRKTAKEYGISITKHPRSIDLIYTLFINDKKEFFKKLEEEKNAIIGKINELSEFNIFEFIINNFQFLIESTLDGCLCSTPNKLDLLKAYSEYMNKEYLEIFRIYWEKFFNKLSNEEIIKMSYILLKYYDDLNKLNVNDENISKNGKELIKIYFKKIFKNILSTIENILKNERELKGIKNEEGIYYTLGPKDLFDILSEVLDLVKEYKHPIIFKELLKIFSVGIMQYAIGVSCVIKNQDIIIENEYLISIANNNLITIQYFDSLIGTIKKIGVLNENEINEEVQYKKIMNSINKISFGAIVRFVYDHKDELAKYLEKANYFDIDAKKIIMRTGEIFGKYKPLMNPLVIKKCWNEILKLTLCYYITSLLLTARKHKNSKDLLIKIKKDKNILNESYTGIVGENLTKSTLKILDDIINFLEVDKCMISVSCLAIREYIGPAFTNELAEKVIELRSDFSKEERIDCIKQWKEILNNYKGPKNEDSSYFILLTKKINKIIKNSLTIKLGESLTLSNQINKKSSSDSDIEEDKLITNKIGDDFKETDIDDFLKNIEDENEQEEEKEGYEEENNNSNDNNNSIIIDDDDDNEGEIIDDFDQNVVIDHEGYLQIKNHKIYIKYYFQIKNDCLYWFKEKNKNKNLAKNKINIKFINQIETSEGTKFSLIINEKDEIRKYKFKSVSEEDKSLWIKEIGKIIKKVKKDNEIPEIQKIEIKQRIKVINDLFKLPNIKIDEVYIKTQALKALSEDFFKLTPEKIEKMRKENEKKKKMDKKELKKEEKEEKKRLKELKKEEKEKEKRLKEEKKEEKKRLKEEKKKEKEKLEKENEGNKHTLKSQIQNFFKGNKKKDKNEDNNFDNFK